MEKLSLKDELVPTRLEVIAYLVLSSLGLGLINISLIFQRVSTEGQLQISPSAYLGSLEFLTRIPAINTAVIVAFWSGIGLVAYTLVWALINAVIGARNEIVVETEYVNRGQLSDRVRLPLIKTGFFGLFLVWFTVCLRLILPELLKNFSLIVAEAKGFEFLRLLIPALEVSVLLAVATALLRLFMHAELVVRRLKPKQPGS